MGNTEYGYDQLSRLTKATPDQGLQALGLPAEQYSYDAVHNRTSSQHQAGAWSYNKDNQLTQYPKLKPFEPGEIAIETSVTYNAQGHTQKETSAQGEKSYGYNAAERLIEYSNTLAEQASEETNATYRYDPMGRRIAKVVTKGAGSTAATYFLYGDSGLMGEADSQGTMSKAYAFSPLVAGKGLWSTDPIWQADLTAGQSPSLTTGATFNYLQTDHLGTPMLATTRTGALSWKGVSEAFGAAGVLQGQSTTTMNLRFPGQYFDEETGTHYNFRRDYQPRVGRFLQNDPVALWGGVNVYAYVGGNPIFSIDPRGLFRLHGNWCGPSWTGGRREPFNYLAPPDYYLPPTDYTDETCKRHDIFFATCRESWKCAASERKLCMRRCNRDLIKNTRSDSLSGASFFTTAIIELVIPLDPDEEKDAPSCACEKN